MAKQSTGQLPIISACMMVRDEERNLPRCLESIKNFADEIIVVDTGSSDKTIEIAKSYGAKVYQHPWEDNFSKHRNQSINYATGEWIFIIDADEELCFTNVKPAEAKKALHETIPIQHKACAIILKDLQGGHSALEFNTSRFFRKGHIRYNGTVHNQPVVSDGDAGAILLSYMQIKHYGYDLTPEQRQKKTTRTVGLLLKQLKKTPDDYHLYFYLCQIYSVDGDKKQCVDWGEKYLAHKDKLLVSGKGNFNKTIYFTIVKTYMALGNQEKAGYWLTEGMNELPGDLDMAFALCEFGMWTNKTELTVLGARQFIQAHERFKHDPRLSKNRFVFNNTPESLSYCLYSLTFAQLNEAVNSISLLKEALKDTPAMYRDGTLADLKTQLINMNLKEFSDHHIDASTLTNIRPEFLDELQIEYPDVFIPYQPQSVN